MPLFYKQGDSPGVWKNVQTPYMKQAGDWIEPEQVYIKEDGSWKLIFEKFTFVVETTGFTETSQKTVLEGRLNDFENDFEPEDSFFFDQKLDQPGYVNATAVNESEKQVAVGGEGAEVYVFDSQLRINRTSSGPTPSRIDKLDTITQPSGEINGLDFDDNVLAVAADQLYIYDEDFNDINVFSADEGNEYTDVEFNPNTGDIAASTPGGYIYIYEIDGANWTRKNKISFASDAVSVSWRLSDSFLAVGKAGGIVDLYNTAFNSIQTRSDYTGEVKVEFNGSGVLATVDEEEVKVYSGDPLTLDETILDSTEGPEGDVDWSGTGFLLHASSDRRVYVYDSNAAYELIKTFNNASRPFKSVSWDSENNQLVGGTSLNGSGEALLYSTGARMFFDWGEFGNDYEYRQRASGLRATGDPGGNFEIGIDGLDPNTQYEFRAGGFAAGGRTVIDVERDSSNNIIEKDTFTTADIDVSTEGSTDTTSTSMTFVGTVDPYNKGGNVDVSFEWGEQGNGLPNEVDAGFVSGSPPLQFSENVGGLAPAQTYEYRAKAKFGGVTVRGSINTVTIDNVTANMVSSDPVDFGTAFEASTQDQGSTSSRNITIEESSGSGDGYNIENVSITGPDAGEFTVVNVPSNAISPDVPSGTQQNIDVRFDAINDGARTASLEIDHDAPTGNDPLQIGLEGVVEKAVDLQVPGTTFTTTADQNEETKTFNINETGGDYDATITSIEEANSQPANYESSEWRIVNRPGNLDGGGNATVPAGGTVSLEIGWNPDTGDAQDYVIDINYRGQGVPNSETEEITINGTVSGIVNIAVDPERDGTTSRGVTDGSFTYTFTDRLDPDTLEDLVPFSIVGDKDGDYTVNEISISGADSEDFFIQNAPASTTDGDSSTGQLVNITNPGEMRFDVGFSPATSDTQSEWNANLDIEADNANNNTHSINLVGLQPSEITTSASSLSFGPTIHGGNFQNVNGTDERTIETVTISNASSDRTFDVTDDAIDSDDFEFFTAGAGSAGTGTIDGGDASTDLTAEIEFAPEPSENYADTTTLNGTYKVSHDAEFGSNPTTVDLSGTVQVTNLSLNYNGTSYDLNSLNTPDFTIAGNLNDGDTETETFTITSDNGNDVGTRVYINSPDNISSVLNLNQEKNSILAPGESITGQMNYDPSNANDSGEIERIEVEWDNSSQKQPILVKGVVGSIINIETQDGTPNDITLEFRTAENTTETRYVVAFEVGGAESYTLTGSNLIDSQSGRFAVENDFDGNSGDNAINETVSPGGSKTATISFSPGSGDSGGSPYIGEFEIKHDAQFETDSFEQSPVPIELNGETFKEANVTITQGDGSTPVTVSTIEDTSTNVTLDLTETGGDTDAVVDEIYLFDGSNELSSDENFSLNDNISYVNSGNTDNLESDTKTINAGSTLTDDLLVFSPPLDSTDSKLYESTFRIYYDGEEATGKTAEVSLDGTALEPSTASISPSSLNLGTYQEENNGPFSDTQSVTVSEDGENEPFNITEVSITGTDDGPYSVGSFPTDVSASGSVTGDVSFSSSNPGYYDNATLEVSHDAVKGPNPLTVDLFAQIEGDPEAVTITSCSWNRDDSSDGASDVTANLSNLPENCDDIKFQLSSDNSTADPRDPNLNGTEIKSTYNFQNKSVNAKWNDDFSGSTSATVSFTTDDENASHTLELYEVGSGTLITQCRIGIK